MPDIKISVRDKVAKSDNTVYVCNNSDYIIKFSFDAEWSAYDTKTARFSYNSSYTDVVFSGNECAVPIISNAYAFYVGIYAGNLHTSTAARVLCRESVLCDDGLPADPAPGIYSQIMERLNDLDGINPATAEKSWGN